MTHILCSKSLFQRNKWGGEPRPTQAYVSGRKLWAPPCTTGLFLLFLLAFWR